MVDDEELRWRHFNVEIPKRMGKIEGLEKFDATFFGVHFKQGTSIVVADWSFGVRTESTVKFICIQFHTQY